MAGIELLYTHTWLRAGVAALAVVGTPVGQWEGTAALHVLH